MAFIDLSTVSVPTPQPYNDKAPTQNSENFYFAALQILQSLQAASFKVGDKDQANTIANAITNLSLSVPPADMTALTQAVKDLKLTDAVIDFGFCRVYLSGQVEYF